MPIMSIISYARRAAASYSAHIQYAVVPWRLFSILFLFVCLCTTFQMVNKVIRVVHNSRGLKTRSEKQTLLWVEVPVFVVESEKLTNKVQSWSAGSVIERRWNKKEVSRGSADGGTSVSGDVTQKVRTRRV